MFADVEHGATEATVLVVVGLVEPTRRPRLHVDRRALGHASAAQRGHHPGILGGILGFQELVEDEAAVEALEAAGHLDAAARQVGHHLPAAAQVAVDDDRLGPPLERAAVEHGGLVGFVQRHPAELRLGAETAVRRDQLGGSLQLPGGERVEGVGRRHGRRLRRWSDIVVAVGKGPDNCDARHGAVIYRALMTTLHVGDVSIDRVEESYGPSFPIDVMLPDFSMDAVDNHGRDAFAQHMDHDTNLAITSYTTWVVRTPTSTILVDTCVGNGKTREALPDFNQLAVPWLERLAAAGLQPEDVDYVVCTHLHVDHVGWNTRLVDGQWVPTFPNARYLVNQREFDFWRPDNPANADIAINTGVFDDSVQPIFDRDQMILWDGDYQIDDTFRLEDGHRPHAGAQRGLGRVEGRARAVLRRLHAHRHPGLRADLEQWVLPGRGKTRSPPARARWSPAPSATPCSARRTSPPPTPTGCSPRATVWPPSASDPSASDPSASDPSASDPSASDPSTPVRPLGPVLGPILRRGHQIAGSAGRRSGAWARWRDHPPGRRSAGGLGRRRAGRASRPASPRGTSPWRPRRRPRRR